MQALTKEMLLSATSAQRLSKEDAGKFLARVTHLQLQGQRLGPQLGSLLEAAVSATVVYAYDNLLCGLEGFEHLRRLQTLFLQHNRLTSMAGLESLPHLRKLHLGHNRLARIEHLEGCVLLEELHVPHQFEDLGHRDEAAGPLEFCPQSMAAISESLTVLDAAGNGLREIGALAPLQGLQRLDLSGNELEYVQHLQELLGSEALVKVELKGNPLAAQERRYRSSVVLVAPSIEEIDGRAVLPQERGFVRRLEEQKRRLRAHRSAILQRQQRGGSTSPVQPSPLALLRGSSTASLGGGGAGGGGNDAGGLRDGGHGLW